jgi:tripartite ATP-independent transporter DctM subunit
LSALAIGGLGLLALCGLILLQVPIGIAMIVVGVAGYALQSGWGPAMTVLAGESAGLLSSVDLATVPLFLMMGTFASAAGFSRDIYRAAACWFGHWRGGLAYSTMGGCAVFGAVCGSSTATAATFAKAALPEMLSRGYSPSFSAGTIAAGGTLKALIPPSIVMILYCVVTKTYIFDLFYAALLPALLALVLNLIAIRLMVVFRPGLAPVSHPAARDEKWRALREASPVLVLMVAIFAGLYSGVFTVNEAASVAAILSLAFAVVRRRMSWQAVWQGLRETASATAMIYTIIIGASVFSYFITLARVPEALVGLIGKLPVPELGIIACLLIAYLALGAIFDEIAAMLITLPFVLPVIEKMGFDPVWWGVVNVVVVELGMIIPPIGIIVFVLHGLAPHIPIRDIYRGVAPFIAADLVLLAILVLFPGLAMWLPILMKE